MASGGARNRSGPPKDPNSLRSADRKIVFAALPNGGYDGAVPKFPLPPRRVYRWEFEDKHRYQVIDPEATELLAERESELWAWAWTTPQACAWAAPGESWRLHTIAMWVRTFAVCESSEATAADKGALHRFADQIGMTPAGLKENGWAVSADEVGEKRDAKAPEAPKSSRDRITVVNGGVGG